MNLVYTISDDTSSSKASSKVHLWSALCLFCLLFCSLWSVPTSVLMAQPAAQSSAAQSSSVQQPASAGAGVRVYTLEDCLKLALGENLDVQNAQAQLNSAAGNAQAAFGQYLPTANFGIGYFRLLNSQSLVPFGDIILAPIPEASRGQFSFNANLNYTVFDGFQRDGSYARAQANYSAADYSLSQSKQRVLWLVRSNYLALLRARQAVRIRQEDFALGKKQLERIRAQYEAGTIAIAPVLTQEADVANRELSVVQAENDYEIARGTLQSVLGMNPGTPAEFADLPLDLEKITSPSEVAQFRATYSNYNGLMEIASKKRRDVAAANASVEAAAAGVRAANSGWYPSLSVGASYSWRNIRIAGLEYGNQTLFAQLQYNIFDGFQRDNLHQQAEVAAMQADVQKRQTVQRVATDVQTALTILTAAEKNLDITARGLKAAQLNFDAAEERFKVGAANIVDLTLANANLATAKINRINALYNYVAAQYQVRFATGTLDE